MVICVECGRPLRQVYKMYGKESIRLSRCVSACAVFGLRMLWAADVYWTPVCVQARCGCIADKYIEFEFVIIMIDVLLHKIEVCYPRAPRQTLVLERRRGRVAPTRAGVSAHPFQPSALLRFRDSREPCASRCPSHASGIQHAASSNNCDVNLAASAVESFTRAAPSRCEFLSCPPPPHAPPPCFVPSFLACSVPATPCT